MNNYKNKIIKNTVITSIDRIVSLAVPFLLFPFIIRFLGDEVSGIWFLCSTVVAYFGMFNQGPGPAIVKYISESSAQRNIQDINKYVSSGFVVFLFFGIISMLIMFLFGYFGDIIFKIEDSSIELYKKVFYLMGLILLIIFPLRTYNSILSGLQEFLIVAISNLISTIARGVLTIILLVKGYGILALVMINFLWLLIPHTLQFFALRFKYPEIRIEIRFFKLEYLKLILQFGGVTFLISLCALFIFQTDRIILGVFLSIKSVTYYTACKRVYDICHLAPLLILQAIMPFASELKALNKDDVNQKLLLLGTKYSYALFIPLGVFTLVMASDILEIWIGKGYAQYGLCLQVLTFHLFFNFLHQAGSQILIGINKIRFILAYYVLALVGNIVLSLILVKKYQILGVALGTTIPFVLLEWMYLKKMLHVLDLKPGRFFKEVFSKNILTLVVSILATLGIKQYYVIDSIVSLTLMAVFIFIASIVVFIYTGTKEEERLSFIKFFNLKKINVFS